MDNILFRHAWLTFFEDATKRLKLDHKDAVSYADALAGKTQALTSPELLPPVLRSKLGGGLLQFQTFTTNLYNQLRRDLSLTAKSAGTGKAIQQGLKLVASALAINEIYKRYVGSIEDVIGLLDWGKRKDILSRDRNNRYSLTGLYG